jgi:hypothetical protein
MSSSSFVLMYASMAKSPEHAMNIASRMAATAVESRDVAKLQRWSRRYVQLKSVFGEE